MENIYKFIQNKTVQDILSKDFVLEERTSLGSIFIHSQGSPIESIIIGDKQTGYCLQISINKK